ncbi:MAG: hypothetical protein KC416_08725, partial [Myxococcales bacterium]|nr:hypothetical protein [Myxococcales bacterium]
MVVALGTLVTVACASSPSGGVLLDPRGPEVRDSGAGAGDGAARDGSVDGAGPAVRYDQCQGMGTPEAISGSGPSPGATGIY